MFFVSGLCVECHCSLECSAGRHGVSGLLLLLIASKVFNCNCGFLIVWMLCHCPKPKPKQQAHLAWHLRMFCNVSACLPRCQCVGKVANEMTAMSTYDFVECPECGALSPHSVISCPSSVDNWAWNLQIFGPQTEETSFAGKLEFRHFDHDLYQETFGSQSRSAGQPCIIG
jgi:hypothetical protein